MSEEVNFRFTFPNYVGTHEDLLAAMHEAAKNYEPASRKRTRSWRFALGKLELRVRWLG